VGRTTYNFTVTGMTFKEIQEKTQDKADAFFGKGLWDLLSRDIEAVETVGGELIHYWASVAVETNG
jgi:hypothetical protein